MEYIKNILYGILIGISNAIPGVSGGTMAVILNIYDKLLYAISLKNIKENLRFLVPVGIGGMAGIFALSKVIVPLRDNYPIVMGFCFIGLIIGSMPVIYRHAIHQGEKTKLRNIVVCIGAFVIMVTMSIMDKSVLINQDLEQMGGMSLKLFVLLVIGTGIATITMIIPGISGSLVMVLIGIYTVVIEGVSTLNWQVLVPSVAGGIIGLIIGIKVIKKFMRFHPQMLYFAILGLVAGSIWTVYPGFTMNLEGLVAVVFGCFLGTVAFLTSREK